MAFYRRRPRPDAEKCADPAKARASALETLVGQEVSANMLYERLCRRYTEQAAAAAVAEMVQLDYVNDARYAEARAHSLLAARKSRRAAAQSLRQKGLAPAEVVGALEAVYAPEDGGDDPELEAAAALVDQASGAVSEVESYISDAMQYSPIDGEVSSVIAEKGELIGSGYPVITLLDMNDLWITFNIKEDLLPKIRIGSVLKAYVPGLGGAIELKVDYIAVQAEYATWSATRTKGDFDIRTFEVKARPVAKVDGLRPGMTVTVNWDEIR